MLSLGETLKNKTRYLQKAFLVQLEKLGVRVQGLHLHGFF